MSGRLKLSKVVFCICQQKVCAYICSSTNYVLRHGWLHLQCCFGYFLSMKIKIKQFLECSNIYFSWTHWKLLGGDIFFQKTVITVYVYGHAFKHK